MQGSGEKQEICGLEQHLLLVSWWERVRQAKLNQGGLVHGPLPESHLGNGPCLTSGVRKHWFWIVTHPPLLNCEKPKAQESLVSILFLTKLSRQILASSPYQHPEALCEALAFKHHLK